MSSILSAHTEPSNLFGHGLRDKFCLDDDYINLNCGSFGCLPLAVRDEYVRRFSELEGNPDRFMRGSMRAEKAEICSKLADFLGAEPESCVLVPNVAHGINTVLRNFPWKTGDVLIMASTTYFIVARTVHALRHLPHHPTIEEFPLTFPTSHSEILERFRQYLRSSKSRNGTTIALFDTIVSTPGIVMPWKEMVSICKAEGVRSLVDAAHSIGHETNINLSEISPDFWVTSCSKWLYVKRGCSLLYVAPRNQSMIEHDLTPSMFVPDGKYSRFQSEFYWSGSMDAMTAMTVKPALEFRQSLGGEQQIVDYCHNLAVQGGRVLAKTLGTEMMCSTGENPLELIGCMVNVALPSSKSATATPQELSEHESKLLEGNVYAQLFILNNCYWVRVSAQVFNQIEDFEKLGLRLLQICSDTV